MPFLSFDVVCVGSPVHNFYFTKKVNKQVHKKLEFSTRVGHSRDHSTSIKVLKQGSA